MHAAVDQYDRDLLDVTLVELGIVEDRLFRELDGGKVDEHFGDDLTGRIAEMAARAAEEGNGGWHAPSLRRAKGKLTRGTAELPKLMRMRDAASTPPSDNPIVAFFDVDNTLLRGASAYHVARAARRRGLVTNRELLRFAWHQATFLFVGENQRHLTTIRDRAMELLDGYTEAELTIIANEVFERDIEPRLWPETVELTREHLRKGHSVWLITASPQIVAQVIADRLGLTGALGTRFEAVDGVFTGQLDGAMLHGERKATAARELIAGTDVNLDDCWAYSDSRNDIPLLTLVGNRVVVNPDSTLTRHAKSHGWTILQLKRSSIRAAQRLVRTEARVATGAMRPSRKSRRQRG